jgi:hypothetical protein
MDKRKYSCEELGQRHELLFVQSLKLNTELRILQYKQNKDAIRGTNPSDTEVVEKLLKTQIELERLRAENYRLEADIIEHNLEHHSEACKQFGGFRPDSFTGVQVPDSLPPL